MDAMEDSFHISPDKKYPTSKKKSNDLLSGASEFDNLGETTAKGQRKGDESEGKDAHLKKSLEEDFEEVAVKYPDELEEAQPEVDNIFETRKEPITKKKSAAFAEGFESDDELERAAKPGAPRPERDDEEDDLERDLTWKRDPVHRYAEAMKRNRERFAPSPESPQRRYRGRSKRVPPLNPEDEKVDRHVDHLK